MSTQEERKNKQISAALTALLCLLLFLCLWLVKFRYENPPPLPKKAMLIELGGGGGGGGSPAPSQTTSQATVSSSGEDVVTQNTEDAPEIHRSTTRTTTQTSDQTVTPTVEETPLNANAMFRKPSGTGQGGEGTGSGTGQGSGVGSGSGGGSGSGSGGGNGSGNGSGNGDGDGYGDGLKGRRILNRPDLTVTESGQVMITIRVDENGNVIDARIDSKNSTITNSKVQETCRQKALTAKFTAKPGAGTKEGHILFKTK